MGNPWRRCFCLAIYISESFSLSISAIDRPALFLSREIRAERRNESASSRRNSPIGSKQRYKLRHCFLRSSCAFERRDGISRGHGGSDSLIESPDQRGSWRIETFCERPAQRGSQRIKEFGANVFETGRLGDEIVLCRRVGFVDDLKKLKAR